MCTYSASGGSASSLIIQQLEQLAQRDAAMADAILVVGVQLGCCFPKFVQVEKRVVAEAVLSAGRADDLASPYSLRHQGARVLGMPQHHEDAAVIGLALLPKFRKEPFVIPGVALLAVAVAPSVVRRVHARLAAQRLHAEARVVSERGQPRCAARVARLGKRVLEESGVRLVGLRDKQASLRNQFDR